MSAPGPSTEGVSVLVCTAGRPHLLGDCVRSILDALGPDDELIVVEAGEGTGAPGELPRDVRLRHLRSDRPGKSRQLNKGLLAARGEVVVVTDDDCRVAPGWVHAMAEPFTDPRVAVAFGNVAGLSGVRDRPAAPVPAGPAPAVTWAYANGAAMAVRRGAAIEVGGFDERLGPGAPLHGEEHDLVLRFQEHGWSTWIAAAPTVQHLTWRDDAETRRNLVVYSRGAGAFLGAALRRAPRRWARTAARRVRYQASLWCHHEVEGPWFGPATSLAFARGFVRGLLLRPRRFL